MQLDAGGFSKGYGPTAQIQTEYLVRGLLDLGYDALNLSHKDFYKGGALLKQLEKQNKFNFLSGSIYYDNGRPFAEASRIMTISANGIENPPFKKLKVGLLGLCDQKDKLLHRAANEPQIKSIDPVDAAQKIVPDLRKKSDIVVLLYHGKYKRLEAVLKSTKGIDVVILGGEYYSARSVVGSDAIIVSTPSLGKHLSGVTLTLDGKKRILAHEKRSIALSDDVKEDEHWLNFVQEFEKEKKEREKNKVKTTSR